MKFLLILSMVVAFLYSAQIDEFALGVKYERDFAKALTIAKEKKKPLMLLVVADYCPWCKKFERKTLEDDEIKKLISSEVVAVVVDKVHDKDRFPSEFNTPLIPTTFFIDPNSLKSLYKLEAYKTKEEFMLEFVKVKKAFKK